MNDSKKGTIRFAYDSVERLLEVTQPERKLERFVYDSTGNLLRRGEREFRYYQPDRLTRTGDATLIYDNAGALIEKWRGGSVIRYSYDPDNPEGMKMKEVVDLLRDVVNRLVNRKKDDLVFIATQLKDATDLDPQTYKYLKSRKEKLGSLGIAGNAPRCCGLGARLKLWQAEVDQTLF